MPAQVTLLYPAVEFDLKYYVDKHMPLVKEKWAKVGLQSWQVIELDPKSGNCVQCILTWDSAESFQKGVASEDGATIMADIPKYTQGKPTIIVGTVIASG